MAERSVTVFSDGGRDIFAFAKHHRGCAAVHGSQLAWAIPLAIATVREAGVPPNAGNVGVVALSRLTLHQERDDFEIVHLDDVAEIGYDTFRVDIDRNADELDITVTHNWSGGTEWFSGSLEQFEEYCRHA